MQHALDWAIRLFLCLFVASMPGSVTRPLTFERVAPPIPDSLKNRDASIDVLVETPEHAPIAGARVRALASLDDGVHLAGEATTDAKGHAWLTKLPPGATWILADARDRARGSTMLVLETGAPSITLELESEHTLDVDVKDDHGAPLANAEIEVVGADPLPVGSRVEIDGRARVGRLGAGPWIVTARAPGYEEITRHGVKEGADASFVLRRMGTVLVHVVGEHDEPIAQANVEVAGAQLWPARTTTTDDHGDVRIAALPDGSYALRAFKDSRVSPIELDVSVHGGDDRTITLRLVDGVFVVAHVVQDGLDADPVDGAAVTVAESGLTPFPIEAVTNKEGRVRIGPILPADATISARSEGFVASNAIAIGTPVPPEIRIVLVKAGTLEGRVVDARGFPIDGATIEVVGTDFSGAPIDDDPRHRAFRAAHFMANLSGAVPLVPMGELGVVPGPVPPIPHSIGASVSATAPSAPDAAPWVSRDDGTFQIAPVSPGRVRLVVRHPQYVETASEVVTLTSGGTAHVDVVMHAGGSLEGRVLDPNGQPAPNVRVTVSAVRGALERTTLTAEDGTFAFASLPADVSVSVALEDDPTTTLVKLPVSIPDGAQKSITLNLPAARKPLDFQVTDDRGYPVDTAQITALSLDPSAPLRSTIFTDARGEAHLAGSAGLPLRLEVSAPSHAPKVVMLAAENPETKIVLGRAESVTGEVRSTRGDPVADAEVAFYTQMGIRRTRTDANGMFALDGLAAGAAEARVRAKGYAPKQASVSIAAQDGARPTEVPRFELEEEAIVEGVVLDSHRDPVQGARVASGGVGTFVQSGVTPPGTAVTDRVGKFRLGELPSGTATLEAYAPDVGRGRIANVRLTSGRTTSDVTITLGAEKGGNEPAASGGVAVTLGITDANDLVIVDVTDGSAAERGGLAPGDIVVAVDGQPVHAIAEARARLNGPIADDVVVAVKRNDTVVTLRIEREAVRR